MATVDGDLNRTVVSSTLHESVDAGWSAVFAFDKAAEGEWKRRAELPGNADGPWVDTIIQGSIQRWGLVEVPE